MTLRDPIDIPTLGILKHAAALTKMIELQSGVLRPDPVSAALSRSVADVEYLTEGLNERIRLDESVRLRFNSGLSATVDALRAAIADRQKLLASTALVGDYSSVSHTLADSLASSFAASRALHDSFSRALERSIAERNAIVAIYERQALRLDTISTAASAIEHMRAGFGLALASTADRSAKLPQISRRISRKLDSLTRRGARAIDAATDRQAEPGSSNDSSIATPTLGLYAATDATDAALRRIIPGSFEAAGVADRTPILLDVAGAIDALGNALEAELESLRPGLAVQLRGAEAAVERHGPDFARAVAVSLRQTILDSLVRMAPDDDVRAAFANEYRAGNARYFLPGAGGVPTQRARLFHITRAIRGGRLDRFVETQVETALSLIQTLHTDVHGAPDDAMRYHEAVACIRHVKTALAHLFIAWREAQRRE